MFHAKAENGQISNSGLAMFDQSCQAYGSGKDQATASRPMQVSHSNGGYPCGAERRRYTARSEAVARDPGSATELWLGRLPRRQEPGTASIMRVP